MTSISRLTTGSRWPGVAALALTLLAAPLALAQKVKLATSMGDIVVQRLINVGQNVLPHERFN